MYHGSKKLLIAAGIACGLLVVNAQAASAFPMIQAPVVLAQNTALNDASQRMAASQNAVNNVIPSQIPYILLRAIPKMRGVKHIAQLTGMTAAEEKALAELESQYNDYGPGLTPERVGIWVGEQAAGFAALKLLAKAYTIIKPYSDYMVDGARALYTSASDSLAEFLTGSRVSSSALNSLALMNQADKATEAALDAQSATIGDEAGALEANRAGATTNVADNNYNIETNNADNESGEDEGDPFEDGGSDAGEDAGDVIEALLP